MLALVFIASGVAAQMTMPPYFNPAVFAALDNDSATKNACLTIQDQLNGCSKRFGNVDGIATAAPDDIVDCACCANGEVVVDAYSACSKLVEAIPSLSTEATAFGELYSVCSATATCSGSTEATTTASSTSSEPTSSTFTSAFAFPSASASATGGNSGSTPTETSSEMITSLPVACSSMVERYDSCIAFTPNFSGLGYRSQASCYCCDRRGQWTDGLDKDASGCADDLQTKTGDLYSAVSVFAGFCKNFSDVCDDTATTTAGDETATSTGSAEPTETSGSNGDSNTDSGSRRPPTGSPPDSLASDLRLQAVTVLTAVVFGGIALFVM